MDGSLHHITIVVDYGVNGCVQLYSDGYLVARQVRCLFGRCSPFWMDQELPTRDCRRSTAISLCRANDHLVCYVCRCVWCCACRCVCPRLLRRLAVLRPPVT